jgi:uncharacterized protein
MGRRAGSADLPLHGRHVPKWLGDRMTRLGAMITEAIVLEYGRDEMLRRLAHPFWFQSFGTVLRHHHERHRRTEARSDAVINRTRHPCLRRRGNHSRQTPHELVAIGDRVGLDGAALAKASRLVAKVDSAAVQDGFDLYLHGFIVTDDGHWVVVQQGMNGDRRQARRYHWLSEGLQSFVDAPHAAIDGVEQGEIVNLTDRRAVQRARLGQSEELAAIERLDEQAQRLERHVAGPSVEALFVEERARSHAYGGQSVLAWNRHPRRPRCESANR